MTRWRITGMRWRRPLPACPDWCAGPGTHLCTVWQGHPSGEHRSEPRVWRLGWGVLVATRVQRIGTAGRLEARLQVDLAASEIVAHEQAAGIVAEIDVAVRSALLSAGWLDADQPDYMALLDR